MSAAAFGQKSDMRVKLNVKDADMIAVAKVLADQTGLQFIVQPSARSYNRVTLQLADATPEEAIAYVCQAAGAYFRRDENGVYIISSQPPAAPIEAAPAVARPAKRLRRIRLLHGDAGAIYSQVAFAARLDPMAPYNALAKFRSMPQIEVQNMPGSSIPLSNLNSNANTFTPRVSANVSDVSTRESGNDVALPGESARQLGAGGGGGGIGGGGGQGGFGGGQGGGQGGQQGGNVTLQGGQGLIPDTIDYISFDPTDNSLIVRGTSEDDINELQNTIASFDIAPRQVQIKVEFITTVAGASRSLGYSVQYNRGTVIAGTDPSAFLQADPVFLTYATGNAVLRLRTLLQENNAKVVTAPIIRTLNNQPATVFSFITQYIFNSTTVFNTGTAGTATQVIPVTFGTSLSVAPRINDDGYITLALSPTVQASPGNQIDPGGNAIPIIASQGVNVVARVRNRETIVLGGLNAENISYNVRRVPVLSDIPIIGQFFRSTTTTKANTELLIFVTPEVVEDDATGPINP